MRSRLLATLLLAAPVVHACDGLRADHAWVRLPPPGMSHTAAYLTLHNAGRHALTVTGVRSVDFASAMLHETRYVEGRAQMRHVESIELAPGQVFRAAPGGAHVMLGGARVELTPDSYIELQITCARGAPLSVWAMVRRTPPE